MFKTLHLQQLIFLKDLIALPFLKFINYIEALEIMCLNFKIQVTFFYINHFRNNKVQFANHAYTCWGATCSQLVCQQKAHPTNRSKYGTGDPAPGPLQEHTHQQFSPCHPLLPISHLQDPPWDRNHIFWALSTWTLGDHVPLVVMGNRRFCGWHRWACLRAKHPLGCAQRWWWARVPCYP